MNLQPRDEPIRLTNRGGHNHGDCPGCRAAASRIEELTARVNELDVHIERLTATPELRRKPVRIELTGERTCRG